MNTGVGLSATIAEALRLWDRQKAEGVSVEDRQAGLERTLRVAWPQRNTWHALCEACQDIGLIEYACSGQLDCDRREPHRPHSYGRPCSCPKGARFRPAPERASSFQQAGQVGRRRTGWTRVGR